jgi:hypothetical protein
MANGSADVTRAVGVVEDNCPICLNTLAAAIAEEEMIIANDTPILPDMLGVVKLETCSHHFCRKWCVRLRGRDLDSTNYGIKHFAMGAKGGESLRYS